MYSNCTHSCKQTLSFGFFCTSFADLFFYLFQLKWWCRQRPGSRTATKATTARRPAATLWCWTADGRRPADGQRLAGEQQQAMPFSGNFKRYAWWWKWRWSQRLWPVGSPCSHCRPAWPGVAAAWPGRRRGAGGGAGAAGKLAIKTLSTEISHSCFF